MTLQKDQVSSIWIAILWLVSNCLRWRLCHPVWHLWPLGRRHHLANGADLQSARLFAQVCHKKICMHIFTTRKNCKLQTADDFAHADADSAAVDVDYVTLRVSDTTSSHKIESHMSERTHVTCTSILSSNRSSICHGVLLYMDIQLQPASETLRIDKYRFMVIDCNWCWLILWKGFWKKGKYMVFYHLAHGSFLIASEHNWCSIRFI